MYIAVVVWTQGYGKTYWTQRLHKTITLSHNICTNSYFEILQNSTKISFNNTVFFKAFVLIFPNILLHYNWNVERWKLVQGFR